MTRERAIWRGFSGCDVLWFAQQAHDFGSFSAEASSDVPPARFPTSAWLRSGRWLVSGPSGASRNDVLYCSWEKSIDESQPAGILGLTLKSGRDWKNLIRAGDAFFVFMSTLDDAEKRKVTLVTLAFVDRVVEGRAADGSGATVEVVNVSARDFGKVLLETATVSDPAFADADTLFYNQELFAKQVGRVLSPTETIVNLLDVFYAKAEQSELVRTQWRFPGAEDVPIASFLDVSTFVQAPTFGYGIHTFPIAESGNVWNLLRTYQNADFNEMFVDVRDVTPEALVCHEYQENLAKHHVVAEDAKRQADDKIRVHNDLLALGDFREGSSEAFSQSRIGIQGLGAPAALALVFRQRPYDTGTFFKLPEVQVDATETTSTEIGRAYHGVFNFFRLHAITLPPELQERIFGIMVNKESISRFGLRRRELETAYPFATSRLGLDVDSGAAKEISFNPIYEYYVWLASTWNAFNELLWEGTIAMRFRPDIRCGVRLRFTRRRADGGREEFHFYVQSVRHNFAFDPGRSSTRVTVTRGIEIGSSLYNPAANLYWTETKTKRWLPVQDPFDYYVSRLMRKAPNEPGSIEPPKVQDGG